MITFGTGALILSAFGIFGTIYYHIYRNLEVVKISKNFYGMGDRIFFTLFIFEFIQLLSLSPLIDESTDLAVKQISIYPMTYLNFSSDVI